VHKNEIKEGIEKMKALKRTLIILLIILLALISFGGIYIQKTKFVENILPEYKLGPDFTGLRNIGLKVSDATKDIYYDLDGNVVDEEGKNTTKKEESVNKEENLTKDNYKKAKEIIEKRLEKIKQVQYTSAGIVENKAIDYYTIKQNEETGKIELKLPENANTDMVLRYVATKGDFTIVDDQDNVLMDNSYIKEAYVGYSSTSSGVTVYLTIQFDKQGTEKLKEISNTFIKTTDEEGNDTTKKIKVKIDDSEMLNTYFTEEISNGMIQLSFGTATGNSLATYAQEAKNLETLLNAGNLPIVYEADENHYVLSDINKDMLFIPAIVIMSLLVIGIIILIVKYKVKGLLGAISIIGYIATFLIIVRLTNVVITLEGVAGIITSIILEYISIMYALNKMKENTVLTCNQCFTKFLPILVPIAISTVILCFVKWLPIYSFGMTMFWGIILVIVYNHVVTKLLVSEK
jgi:protein-export membrane protein, secD/secF family